MKYQMQKKKLPKYPQPKLPPNLSIDITFIEPSGNDFLDAEEEGEIQFKPPVNGQPVFWGVSRCNFKQVDLINYV